MNACVIDWGLLLAWQLKGYYFILSIRHQQNPKIKKLNVEKNNNNKFHGSERRIQELGKKVFWERIENQKSLIAGGRADDLDSHPE